MAVAIAVKKKFLTHTRMNDPRMASFFPITVSPLYPGAFFVSSSFSLNYSLLSRKDLIANPPIK